VNAGIVVVSQILPFRLETALKIQGKKMRIYGEAFLRLTMRKRKGEVVLKGPRAKGRRKKKGPE